MIHVPRLPQAWAVREAMLRLATRLVADEGLTCPGCHEPLYVTDAETPDAQGRMQDTIIAACVGCDFVLEIGREVRV